MASIFDSPLFWIILIWWLLSTIFGAKARQRRAAQARSRQREQPPTAGVESQREDRTKTAPGWGRPAETEVEGEFMEPPAGEPGSEPGEPTVPSRPSPPPKPISPLESLFRNLGVPESGLPSVLRPQRDIFPVEPPAPVPAEVPESPPPEPPEEVPEPPLVEYIPRFEKKGVPLRPPVRDYPLLPGTTISRLTPLQQAIVFKEILDRPRAQRRAIR